MKTHAELKDHRKLVNLHYMTRDDVVPYYANLILNCDDNETKRINNLILTKWKPSGLIYIKEKAWKTEIHGMTLMDAWRKDFNRTKQ
jgi:hypothetical protein